MATLLITRSPLKGGSLRYLGIFGLEVGLAYSKGSHRPYFRPRQSLALVSSPLLANMPPTLKGGRITKSGPTYHPLPRHHTPLLPPLQYKLI